MSGLHYHGSSDIFARLYQAVQVGSRDSEEQEREALGW